jgi:hypothetical protein
MGVLPRECDLHLVLAPCQRMGKRSKLDGFGTGPDDEHDGGWAHQRSPLEERSGIETVISLRRQRQAACDQRKLSA